MRWQDRNNAIDWESRIRQIRETESLCTNCQADAGLHREDLATLPLPSPNVKRYTGPTDANIDLEKRQKQAQGQKRDERGLWREAS